MRKTPLSLRLLAMLLALVMVVSVAPMPHAHAAEDGTTLYLKPNANWLVDGARFAVYYWDATGENYNWLDMTDADADGYYEVTVPAGYSNIIFCRMTPSDLSNNWDNKWNQTSDLQVPTDGTNCYTVAEGAWDKGEGAWSTYTPAGEEVHEHSWTDASCTEPKTCAECGETEGEALGHDYVDGVCSRCGDKQVVYVAQIESTGEKYETLADAVAAAAAGDTIYLLKDTEFSTAVTISKKVTITAESPVTVTKASYNEWLLIKSGGDVTLEGPITVVGTTGMNGALIEVASKGILTMNDGVTLKDNSTKEGKIAGGVNIKDGTFTMNGGTISNCGTTDTSKPGTSNGGSIGGAVRVSLSATSTVNASFTMNGGTITGCSAAAGGAVGVENLKNSKKMSASFVMNGGTITECTETTGATGGAAVMLWNLFYSSNKTIEGATFTMNGGKIVNNTGEKYGVINPGANGLTSLTAAGHIYILGGEISGNFVGNGSNNSPSSFYGNGIYLANVFNGEALLTVGGNAVIDDEVFIKSASGNHIEVQDDFTGTLKIFSQEGGLAGTHGTLVAKSESGTASAAVAARIIPLYNYLTESSAGDRYEHPECSVVVGTNAGEYVLGPKTAAVPEYTVTYTDGVEGEEVFADQVYTVAEGEATPAFEGTPAREGYEFLGWEPAVAETVTAEVTYTAQWKEAARGAINGVGYREDNEGIALELENVLAYESVAVKVYSGETLLTTVSLRNIEQTKDILGAAQDFLTVSIRTTGESSSWEATDWLPTDGVAPTKYELYIDGTLMDTHEEAVDVEVWNALLGTKAFFTITYTDGVEDEEVFADQVYTVEEGAATPAFEGTPARSGYTFEGWEPAVADSVTDNVTYVAQWEKIVVYVAQLESTGEKFETLQAAVDAAQALMVNEEGAAQTVTLLTDVTESVAISWTPKSGYPDVTLTIDLNGKTVTGKEGSVFTVRRNGSYTMKLNVVFKDSVGTGVVTGGTGTLNGSNTYGGAIYAIGGSSYVTIEGGTWTGNTATHGGVYAGAYTNNTNHITINGGTLTGNTATGNGGAIYGRYAFINGGTITGNTAASGGGVYVFISATTKIEMTGGAVYGNTATTDGDDILWRANKGNTSTAYMKLIDAASMEGANANGWYVDAEDARFSEDNAVVFADYAKYTTLNTRVALKAAFVPVKYTVTYTDGVEDEEVFADQVYTVAEGEATPAFEGTPEREGYRFTGWTPEVAETVTADAVYTAQWKEIVYVAQIESTGEKYETLQAALDAANLAFQGGSTAETITMIADTTECVRVTWKTSKVSITIDLNGHTVTGDGTGSVFYLNSGSGISNITHIFTDSVGTGVITGGVGFTNTTSNFGGAIYVNSAACLLTINGGTFTGNTAALGGAIDNRKSATVINGGTFTGNTAEKCGGAINASNLTVNGGVITGNVANGVVDETSTPAASAGGGGIYVTGSNAKLTVNGGKIYGNTATAWGDDIVFKNTNKSGTGALKLMKASDMNVEGVSGWYVDGVNGKHNDASGRTDRYSEDNAVEHTALSMVSPDIDRYALALKATEKPVPVAPEAPTANYLYTMQRGFVVYMVENYNVLADGTSGTPKVSDTPRAVSFNAEPDTYELSEVYQGEDGEFYVDLTITDLEYYLEWYLEEHETSKEKYDLDDAHNGTVTVSLKWNGHNWIYVETADFNANRGVYVYVVHTKHNYPSTWTVEKEATCTEEGLQTRQCEHLAGARQDHTRCNCVESQVIEALGHDYVDGVCTRCGEADPDAPVAPEAPTANYLYTMQRGFVVYMVENYNVLADGTSGTPKVSDTPRAVSFNAEPDTYELSEVYQGEDGEFYVDLTITDLEYYLEWYLEEHETSKEKYDLDDAHNGTVTVSLKWNGSKWIYEETADFNANRGVYVYVVHTKHNYPSTWTVEKEATCTEEGLQTRQCEHLAGARQDHTRCNCVESQVIEALGHTEEVVPGKAATCTEPGLTEGKKCSVCDEVLVAQEEIPALGHTEEVVPGKAATCTEPGLTEGKKCSVCDEVLVAQEEIPALGHTEEVVPGKAATCTEPGLTDGKVCSVCDEVLVAQEEISALGHTEEVVPGKEPTCTEKGLTDGKVCSVCDEVLVAQEEIPALGHTEEVVPGKEPTCTEPGLTDGKVCSVCDEVLVAQEEIPATGHDYKDGYCQDCGEPDPDYEGPIDPSTPDEPEDPTEPEEPALTGVIRVAGENRIETSLKLADQLKETLGVEKFNAVVVASAMNFPDALTGSYLATAKNAPILLTTKGFEAQVNAYINANLAAGGTVYVLGGETAVPSELLAGVSGVKRVAGADRFGTNLEILKETGVSADQPILIATAVNFADSLSASATGLPMLLVYGKLSDAQKAFLATTSKKFIIVGGENAVSADLEAELKAIGSVERLAGASRYETSVMVAEKFISNPDDVVLAYARNFPDGLCGGPVAYALGAPLILTDNIDPSVADKYVDGISAGIVVGGDGLISDASARAIFDLAADAVIEKK